MMRCPQILCVMLLSVLVASCRPAGKSLSLLQVGLARYDVEVVFEHAGPRRPVFEGESDSGVWFVLRNGSPYPIAVYAVPVYADYETPVLLETPALAVRGIEAEMGRVVDVETKDEFDPVLRGLQSIRNYSLDAVVLEEVVVPSGKELRFSLPLDALVNGLNLSIDVVFSHSLAARSSRSDREASFVDQASLDFGPTRRT